MQRQARGKTALVGWIPLPRAWRYPFS